MKPQIDLVGIVTNNMSDMKTFYTTVLGFEIALEMEEYVEFKHDGVRFGLTTGDIMAQATGEESYKTPHSGHSLELAFKIDDPKKLDDEFAALIEKGAKKIKDPEDMPWNQRTAFFADPDGNIHELFADL